MTSLQLTLPVSGGAPALLNLPYPLTPQGLLELEHAVSGTLSTLRRDLLGASVEPASVHVLPPSDAAEIEYAERARPGTIHTRSANCLFICRFMVSLHNSRSTSR
jgi:hypothetical protein